MDTVQDVSEMDTVTFGEISNSLVIGDETSANSVVATPDSEERCGAEDICGVCEIRVGFTNIGAVNVCETCHNYFHSVGKCFGEEVSCVDGSNKCNFESLDT